MSGRFDGKVVWITGASSGIGQACAREFAREGARLALSARRAERLDELVAELEGRGAEALAVPCDVTDEEALGAAVEETVARFGRLDVVLANAGGGMIGTFDELTVEDWRRHLELNVLGVVGAVKHAMPHLRESRGRIGLVASVSAFLYAPRNGAYNASKAAVRALGLTLSTELDGTGVSCTTIHPGFVRSEIVQVDRDGQHHADWEDRRPAQLLWEAEDAARVMVRAIHRRKREFVFTAHGKLGKAVAQHLPGLTAIALGSSSRKRNRKG